MPKKAKKAPVISKAKKVKRPAAKTGKENKTAAAAAKKPAKAIAKKEGTKPVTEKSTKASVQKKTTKMVTTKLAAKGIAKKSVKAVATKKATPKSKRKPSAGTSFMDFEPYQVKRGEEYMNEVQREHFKSILLNWKAELMEEVDRTVTHMKDEAANFPDPADRATQEEEFSLELRTRDRERKLIKKIDSTISIIDQDDYGFCNACGVEISIKRLEARPTANLCIDCKTLDEIKERQERG